jgi:DnaK suppressor protein
MVSEPTSLRTERETTAVLVEALQGEFDGIIESATAANSDDEHDPDGSTIGYERARVAALLGSARRRLVSLDQALDRASAGTYGICQVCDGAIALERLAALPETTRCINCA